MVYNICIMKVIKYSIFTILFFLLALIFVNNNDIAAKEISTKSIFCRQDSKNATFKLRLKLDKNYYKYKIKICFYKQSGEKTIQRKTVKPGKNIFFTAQYSYFDIGFNTDVKVKIKKYKSIIIDSKEKKENKTIIESNNLIENITSGLSKNEDVTINFIEEESEEEVITPKCKTVILKKTYEFRTLNKQDALLNYKDNEDNCIYSQPLRETDGYYDCSSFVYNAYKSIGLRFSEFVGNTETILHYMEQNGEKVKWNNLQVGDVILYFDKKTSTYKKHYKHVTHVSMYVGNGQIFEYSGAGVNCRVRNIGYYEKHSKAKAFRILNNQ